MKCEKETMLLYAVTDRMWTGKQTLMEQVEDALKGGATCVQLREKELDEENFLKEAIEMKALCAKYGVPFIVNDNVGNCHQMQGRRDSCRAERHGGRQCACFGWRGHDHRRFAGAHDHCGHRLPRHGAGAGAAQRRAHPLFHTGVPGAQ